MDIPVFHDDQHGTAIVVLAGVINALRVTGKTKEDSRVVVNGAGSAGIAITKLLLTYGFKHITMCDRSGIIHKGYEGLNWMQEKMCDVTNLENQTGTLADALKGADIFIGVSAPNIVTQDMVRSMNKDAIIFAMANPVPEIMPDAAKEAGARIVGTGRSDFPNQINNVVAFPGIFKGALEGRARQITEEMKLAAAQALASLVSDAELSEDNIMPYAFDPGLWKQSARPSWIISMTETHRVKADPASALSVPDPPYPKPIAVRGYGVFHSLQLQRRYQPLEWKALLFPGLLFKRCLS